MRGELLGLVLVFENDYWERGLNIKRRSREKAQVVYQCNEIVTTGILVVLRRRCMPRSALEHDRTGLDSEVLKVSLRLREGGLEQQSRVIFNHLKTLCHGGLSLLLNLQYPSICIRFFSYLFLWYVGFFKNFMETYTFEKYSGMVSLTCGLMLLFFLGSGHDTWKINRFSHTVVLKIFIIDVICIWPDHRTTDVNNSTRVSIPMLKIQLSSLLVSYYH